MSFLFYQHSKGIKKMNKKQLYKDRMSKLLKAERVSRVLYWVVMGSFIATLIYVPLRAIFDEVYRENTEYRIMIFQTVFGLLVINLPSFLTKKFMWKIPPCFFAAFMLFLWGAIFAGEAWQFYYRIPFWDNILHLMSSMMAALLGFSLIDILNNDKKHSAVSLSPFFVAVFSVAFAVLIGVLWEIYEFVFDGALGLNMQKFAIEAEADGEILADLVGRAALHDTMMDLIVDTLGAVVIATVGYISLKFDKGWINAFKVEVGSKDRSPQYGTEHDLSEEDGADCAQHGQDGQDGCPHSDALT